MDFYDFVEQCREDGLDGDECLREWSRVQAERSAAFMEAYESDPEVQYGWHQSDLIEMYRRER